MSNGNGVVSDSENELDAIVVLHSRYCGDCYRTILASEEMCICGCKQVVELNFDAGPINDGYAVGPIFTK